MIRKVFLWILFQTVLCLNAQYTPVEKLQNLYEKGLYADCIEKSNGYLEDNREELYPYFWQLRSYLAIHEAKAESKNKIAYEKAVNIALKLAKKDKKAFFKSEYPDVYEELIDEGIKVAKSYCSGQFEKAEALYRKLEVMDSGNALVYSHYQCRKSSNIIGSEILLKEIVDRDYSGHINENKSIDNSSKFYLELVSAYMDEHEFRKALIVCSQALKVYPNNKDCHKLMLDYEVKLVRKLDFNSEMNDIQMALQHVNRIDSVYHHNETKALLHKVYYTMAGRSMRLNSDQNVKEVNTLIRKYLGEADQFSRDTCLDFFLDYKKTFNGMGVSEQTKIFSYLTETFRFYQRKTLFDAAMIINSELQNRKYWRTATEYLNYCSQKFPTEKASILKVRQVLEDRIIKEVNAGNYNEELDFSDISNNQKIREIQLQKDIEVLKIYLMKKQFDAFTFLVNKNLRLFPNNSKLLELKKQGVIADYRDEVIAKRMRSTTSYFSKTPVVAKCDAGELSKEALNSMLERLHYIRRLAGIPDTLAWDSEMNRNCQQAALMMEANGMLSHFPATTWKCYSKSGALAAGSSNLSLGYGFEDALMGQMEDGGEGNYSCGHRRWILNPDNRVFGIGSTNGALSIKVFGYSGKQPATRYVWNDSQFISWPSADYFPKDLVPKRWSFSLEYADFSKAKVSVIVNGKSLKVKQEKIEIGYGMNTLVWTIEEEILANVQYSVVVSEVIIGAQKPKRYSYKVSFIDIN